MRRVGGRGPEIHEVLSLGSAGEREHEQACWMTAPPEEIHTRWLQEP